MRTLACHEAIPGHHFQLAIQQQQDELPFFRRLVPFTAYAEGWALYAEQLAWELGFQQDPYDNIGRLQAELFRAARYSGRTGAAVHKQTEKLNRATMLRDRETDSYACNYTGSGQGRPAGAE